MLKDAVDEKAYRLDEFCLALNEADGRKAYRVEEFCLAHRITRATLWALWNEGRGPKVIKLSKGKKAQLLIPVEAAEEWRLSQMAQHVVSHPETEAA